MPAEELRGRQLLWATIDSPWVHKVAEAPYMETVRATPFHDATTVFSTHLPPASGLNTQFAAMLAEAPTSDPFVGPDQQALEAMLASFEPVPAAT